MSFKKLALTTALLASLSGMSINAMAAPSQEITLQGIITSTTCDVTVNGGKSILNVGAFKSVDFAANEKLGDVTMPVALTNCAADETGNLIVQGLTSVKNNDKNIFVSEDANTVGFMIADAAGDVITNNQEIEVEAKVGETTEYNFTVGMASTAVTPEPGAYSAPILVAYIVE